MVDQQLCYSQKNVRTSKPKNIFLQRLYSYILFITMWEILSISSYNFHNARRETGALIFIHV